MYGKIFASMYEGSMVGAGPVVFSVWGYCIAKAEQDGTVLLNPILLAPIIGTSRVEIELAIKYLTEPDVHSKNPDHEGRRLLHQSGFLYLLVSHQIYQGIKNGEDRREYMREYMRKKRGESDAVNSLQSLQKLTSVNPTSTSTSTSMSKVLEKEVKGEEDDSFAGFWKAYPRKVAKGSARKAWKQTAKTRPNIEVLLKAIEAQKESADWQKDAGQFVPYPATWLRAERWGDEVIKASDVQVVNEKPIWRDCAARCRFWSDKWKSCDKRETVEPKSCECCTWFR